MQAPHLLQKLTRVPRRLLRESIMYLQLARLATLSRFGRQPITHPGGPVVSLTSYGKRIGTAHLAIESISRGSSRPSRLLLWIDDEFLFSHLPTSIQRLQKRGLEVTLCRDYGPHKKYYAYVESQGAFRLPLVTADDDILYPRYWLKGLIKANHEHPDVVNCYGAHVIPVNESGFERYKSWKLATSTIPCYCHVAMGGLGTIYPPAFLAKLKCAGESFTTCCPTGDDLWLHVQAVRARFKVRQILPRLPYFSFQMIPRTQQYALSCNNVDRDGNELQINATYTAEDISFLWNNCAVRVNLP